MSKNPCGLDYCPYMDLVGEFANCTACSWAKALPCKHQELSAFRYCPNCGTYLGGEVIQDDRLKK